MKRATALDYLQNEYQEMATEVSFDSEQALRAYGIVIDQALRLLGYQEDELPTADTRPDESTAYLAALDYFALARFARVFSIRTDAFVSGLSVSQSQAFGQVTYLKVEAAQRLAGLGFSPEDEMQMGRLTLDFVEPSLEGAG